MSDIYDLSIIIPHYNTPELLEKLLSTIPDNDRIQTIIVDDHSSEDARQKLQTLKARYKDRPFFFCENNGKQNAGAARNVGLAYAEGDWVLFADSDDYFIEGFYDAVSEYFDKDYDLVFFKSTSIYTDTGEEADRHIPHNNRIDNYLLDPSRKAEIQLRTRWNVPFAKLIRTKMINENNIKFDEIPVANDNFFSTQIGFYADKISASNKVIYCITRNRGSLTTRLDLKTFETRVNAEIKQNNFLRENLSRQDFAYVGRFAAYEYLYLILKRKYGMKIFVRYFKIFAQNHMFHVSIKGLRKDSFTSFIRTVREEKKIKDKYSDM